jgi:GDP-L-fucose synthase
LAAMPTNLYGQNDSYDLQNSHVLPALIRKMHEAKICGDNSVVVWGTGTPRREFLYSEDMAEACIYLLNLSNEKYSSLLHEHSFPLINVGCGEDVSINELANMVKDIVGFTGSLAFDTSKPDGTMRKLMDVGKLKQIGWQAKMQLRDGIAIVYKYYLEERG